MKSIITLIIFSSIISCSKEQSAAVCVKVKVVGYNYCSPVVMGAQIIEGPKIGEVFRNYDNVISIFGVDQNKFPVDTVLYCTVRDKKSNDDVAGICLAI